MSEMQQLIERMDRVEKLTLLAAKNVLQLDDVVLLTGLSKSWLYKATSAGQIPHYKPNGKTIYFDRKEIEDWLKQNRIGTVDEAVQNAADYLVSKKK